MSQIPQSGRERASGLSKRGGTGSKAPFSGNSGELVVGLQATYQKYVPGSGPPLRPITLLPRVGSTGYIRDEYRVPQKLSQDDKAHVVYLVGFRDLEAARIPVDAEHIREYVSEREYEEWNYKVAVEEAEEERQREEQENLRLVEEAMIRAEPEQTQQGGRLLQNRSANNNATSLSVVPRDPSPQKNIGRPAKKQRARGPSLSNPAAHVPTVEGEYRAGETEAESNEEAAIFRQLQGDDGTGESEYESRTSSVALDESNFISSGPAPQRKKRRTTSPSPLQRVFSQPSQPLRTKSSANSLVNGKSNSAAPKGSLWSFAQGTAKPARLDKVPVKCKTETPVPLPATANFYLKNPLSMPKVSSSSKASTSKAFSSKPSTRKPAASEPPKAVETSSTRKQKSSKRKADDGPPPAEEPVEQVYEVKRLLETKILEPDGKPKRYFLVLWKGSWPAHENPTWEPEENIPKKMARRFMMAEAAHIGIDGTSDTPRKSSKGTTKPKTKTATAPATEASRTSSQQEAAGRHTSASQAFVGGVDDRNNEGGDIGDGNGFDVDKVRDGRNNDHHDSNEGNERLRIDNGRTEESGGDEDPPVSVEASGPQVSGSTLSYRPLTWEMLMGRRFGKGIAG